MYIELIKNSDGIEKKSLKKSIRRCFQYYSESLPRLISQRAYDYNKSHNNIDLQTIDAFNRKRGEMVLEHTTPIMTFIDYLISLPNDKLEEEILNYSGCCWIIKDEDKELTKLGFRTKRNNWKESYKSAGIVLI